MPGPATIAVERSSADGLEHLASPRGPPGPGTCVVTDVTARDDPVDRPSAAAAAAGPAGCAVRRRRLPSRRRRPPAARWTAGRDRRAPAAPPGAAPRCPAARRAGGRRAGRRRRGRCGQRDGKRRGHRARRALRAGSTPAPAAGSRSSEGPANAWPSAPSAPKPPASASTASAASMRRGNDQPPRPCPPAAGGRQSPTRVMRPCYRLRFVDASASRSPARCAWRWSA